MQSPSGFNTEDWVIIAASTKCSLVKANVNAVYHISTESSLRATNYKGDQGSEFIWGCSAIALTSTDNCFRVTAEKQYFVFRSALNLFFIFSAGSCLPQDLQTSGEFIQVHILDLHNLYRRRENSTSMLWMSWDAEAAVQAQNWADQCKLRHPLSHGERQQYLKITSKWLALIHEMW